MMTAAELAHETDVLWGVYERLQEGGCAPEALLTAIRRVTAMISTAVLADPCYNLAMPDGPKAGDVIPGPWRPIFEGVPDQVAAIVADESGPRWVDGRRVA